MIESIIRSKGQTTIPKVVREVLGVKAGGRVRYIISDDIVQILPVQPINRLFGALQYNGPALTLEEMEENT